MEVEEFPIPMQPPSRMRRVLRWLGAPLVRIIPLPLLRAVFVEIQAAGARLRSRRLPSRYATAENLLVNLGAGTAGCPGWVNVDIVPLKGVNCVCDCRKALPFRSGSVKCIFTEHFLEHVEYDEDVPRLLKECWRVLQPGGVLRIVVPDAGSYLHAYCRDDWDALSQIRPLDADRTDFYSGRKYNTKIELINHIFRQGLEHRFAYDYETLRHLLDCAGFSMIKRQRFGESLMEELALDQPVRASESLYVDAVKPRSPMSVEDTRLNVLP